MKIEDKRYSIKEVFDLIGIENLTDNSIILKNQSNNMIVDGFNVRPKSLRYQTFYQKGIKCIACGKEGTHFKLCGDETTNRRHFNLFAEDGTLMTKDHIIPKSKGGQDKVSNMQTMCVDCNKAKGNTHPGIELEYLVAHRVQDGVETTFASLEQAAMYVVRQYMRPKNTQNQWAKRGIRVVLKIMNALKTDEQYNGCIWTWEKR